MAKTKKQRKPKSERTSFGNVAAMATKITKNGSFRRITDAAKAGASRDELKLLVIRQFVPGAQASLLEKLPQAIHTELDFLVDDLEKKYSGTDNVNESDEELDELESKARRGEDILKDAPKK